MPRSLAALMFALGLLLAVSLVCARPATSDSWNQLADDYINQSLAFSPTASTQIGIHIHDSELDDYGLVKPVLLPDGGERLR